MNIDIWNGSSTFSAGQTSFGYFDSDASFIADADKVAVFCANSLGYPMVQVELDSGSFYKAFEQAVMDYANEVYGQQLVDNFYSLQGTPSGSNVNDVLITPSLGAIIRLSKTYGSEAGSGGDVNIYSGSVRLHPNVQVYNLNEWAASSASLSAGDSIEIKRIYYQRPPSVVQYYDPLAGSGLGMTSLMDSFGFNGYTPAINYTLFPLNMDALRIQSIELNNDIRRSGYSFELMGNVLRIFPIPTVETSLWINYIKQSERNSSILTTSGSGIGNGQTGLITNPSNAPYANIKYSTINSLGKSWIFRYALALCKRKLGYVRGKYSTIPIPNSEVTMNQGDLLSAADAEITQLLDQLRDMLDKTSRKSQIELQNQQVNYIRDTLSNVPMAIYVG